MTKTIDTAQQLTALLGELGDWFKAHDLSMADAVSMMGVAIGQQYARCIKPEHRQQAVKNIAELIRNTMEEEARGAPLQ